MGEKPPPRRAIDERLRGRSTWREDVLQEADRVQTMLERSQRSPSSEEYKAVFEFLELARKSATYPRTGWDQFVAWWTGADIERAWLSIHSAKQALILVGRKEDVQAQIPVIRAKIQSLLRKGNKERTTYEKWLDKSDEPDEELARARVSAARAAADRESDLRYANVRRFRNTLIRLLLAVVALNLLLVLDPPADPWLPICAAATEQTGEQGPGATGATGTDAMGTTAGGGNQVRAETTAQPEPGDVQEDAEESCPQVWHLEVAGLIGGLLAAAASLRRIRITGEPYALRAFQAALKVPMGALTAVVGTMLLQTSLIDAFEPQPVPDILIYAVIFGASQEAVTRFIDKKANSILEGDQETGADEDEETG